MLSTMLNFAVEQDLIKVNPCGKVRKLKNDKKKIEIITVEEVQRLFPEKWEGIWENKEVAYIGNRLASLTGMRIGEILGLRGEYVFENYIHICGQYGYYGFGPTKTKETRSIPLIPEMMGLLNRLKKINGEGYLFSADGGAKPISRYYFNKYLTGALAEIGIDADEKKGGKSGEPQAVRLGVSASRNSTQQMPLNGGTAPVTPPALSLAQ